jgi:hypothetical protein
LESLPLCPISDVGSGLCEQPVPPVPTSHDHYRSVRLRGIVSAPKVLQIDTYCLRTGDRCMSLGRAGPEVVTLMLAGDEATAPATDPPAPRARQQAQRETKAPVKIAMMRACVVMPITAVTTTAEIATTKMAAIRMAHHMCAWPPRGAARERLNWDVTTAPLCASSMCRPFTVMTDTI